MIVSSTYTEGPKQADGRRYVTEQHTDDAGKVYAFEWLGEQDAAPVLSARADRLNKLIAADRAAREQVAGTRLPLTKWQFRQIFTGEERAMADAFEATLEKNPALDEATKAAIRTGFKDFNAAEEVAVPFIPAVIQMLGLFVAVGILKAERQAEIVAVYG
jgi:hypothetical protein